MPPLMDSDHLHLLTGIQTKLQGLLKHDEQLRQWLPDHDILKAILTSSSTSVAYIAAIEGKRSILEEQDIRRVLPERLVHEGYAHGYGVSKWACEVLLREVEEQFALSVSVFRCGMILADRIHRGQINTEDLVTRFLCGIIYTGIAPASFYSEEEHFIHKCLADMHALEMIPSLQKTNHTTGGDEPRSSKIQTLESPLS
jgi:thioester reductase-like protein